MKVRHIAVVTLSCLLLLSGLAVAAGVPESPKKQTKLGKYVTAAEAYALYQKDKDHTAILDVRTPEEYDLIGHPDMAKNIPIMLRTGAFDAAGKRYPLAPNKDFVSLVEKAFPKNEQLIVMCRSGDRSAMAANVLADAGFTNVYTMVDGFEGDKVGDKSDPHFGQRSRDGWKNSGNPWTYDLDPALVYQPAAK